MGFSVSGATAIIFVSLLFGLGMFYGSVSNGAEQVSDARDTAAETGLDRTNTAINLTNSTYDAATDTLRVRVTNEGSTALSVNDTDVLVDNAYQPRSTLIVAVGGNAETDLWLPGEVLAIEVGTSPAPERVTITTERGIAVSEAL